MSYVIHPTMTTGRRYWLKQLRDHGPGKRPRNRCGYDCMALGWTEWLVTDRNKGDLISWEEAKRRYPEGDHLANINMGFLETITAKGRQALENGHG